MNRKERRAQAARGSDTMGASYTFSGVPESITNSDAFKRGQQFAQTGELPPGYVEAIYSAAADVRRWLALQSEPPELRWLDPNKGGALIIAGLDAGAGYLADSPDAHRLLQWLDDATGRKLSLNMATWALRIAGQMPMPKEARE